MVSRFTDNQHGGSRPSLDTEAVSADEGGGDTGGYEEIQFDPTTLNPACLEMPTIPNTLGAEDIDKVIAALTNVPDVHVPAGLISGEKRGERTSQSAERSRPDYDNDGGRGPARERRRQENGELEDLYRGRGGRGGGRGGFRDRDRDRGGSGRGGYDRGPRGGFDRGGGGFRGARGKFPVARGRNIFPEEGRGRRGRMRVNNLFKRFQQQHRKNDDQEVDLRDLQYGTNR